MNFKNRQAEATYVADVSGAPSKTLLMPLEAGIGKG